MIAKVAFLHTSDERLIALSELPSNDPKVCDPRFSLTTFDHENTFIKLAALADIPQETKVDILAAVLLSVAQPVFPHRWVEVNLSDAAMASLRLDAESVQAELVKDCDDDEFEEDIPSAFQGKAEQFYRFLMQAPTPFVMMSGPEHRIDFINPAYVKLIGRLGSDTVLGKPIREALPELRGQPFYGLLDRVYRTGVPYVGLEVQANLMSEAKGEVQECFFDFIYHPLRDEMGAVSGIMVQATEVTERVISRAALNSREDKLYDQWQELEAIYKFAPVGVILIETGTLKILRMNEIQSEFMGQPSLEGEGKVVTQLDPRVPAFESLLERASQGESIRNTVIETGVVGPGQQQRRWLVNIVPLPDKVGEIGKLYAISLEVPPASPSFLN